jgi:hypothetical protein
VAHNDLISAVLGVERILSYEYSRQDRATVAADGRDERIFAVCTTAAMIFEYEILIC